MSSSLAQSFRGRLAVLAVCALAVASVRASALDAAATPDSDALLERVVSALPREPLGLTGELIVRKRHGVVLRTLKFEMALNWGANPSEARYNIRDAFGNDLEQLLVKRRPGSDPEFSFASGSPLTNAPLPDLSQPLQQTDLSWMDLALSFLWWKGGTVTGMEKLLDRECYIVDIPAPAAAAGRYASVRLWIDREMSMLLQAEGRDAAGRPLRRLWVRSFKRFDTRWMIKDMEVQQFPGDSRTKLQIHDVQGAEPAAADKVEPEHVPAQDEEKPQVR